MNLARSIAFAALPERVSVLGCTLKDFTISHWIWLNRFEVSFVTGADDHSIGDLLLSVLICQSTHKGFAESLENGTAEKRLLQLRRRLTGGTAGRIVRALRRFRGQSVTVDDVLGFDITEECAKMAKHIDAHCFLRSDWATPNTAQVDSPEMRKVNSPAPILYLTALMAELGMSFDDAVNTSIPMARWLVAVNAERAGRITVLDNDEIREDKRKADEFAQTILSDVHCN